MKEVPDPQVIITIQKSDESFAESDSCKQQCILISNVSAREKNCLQRRENEKESGTPIWR